MGDFSLSFFKALMTTTLNYTATGLNIQLGAAVEFVASSSPKYPAVVAVIKAGGTEADVRAALDGNSVAEVAGNTDQEGDGTHVVREMGIVYMEDLREVGIIEVEIGYQNVYGSYAGQNKDGDFDVFGDEEFLAAFESYETALDYAKGAAHRYDEVTVEGLDGQLLASLNERGLVEHAVEEVGMAADLDEPDDSLVDEDEQEARREWLVAAAKRAEAQGDAEDNDDEVTFDVYGDGAFVQEFPSEEAAVDFVAQEIRRHRAFEVRQGEEVVRTIRGLLDLYMVVVDGKAHDGFYSLPVAKGEAIGLFATEVHSSVKVLGLQGEVLLDLAD